MSIFRLEEWATIKGELINGENAWHTYINVSKLLRAIDLVDKNAVDVYPVEVVVLDQLYPTPRKASISPMPSTYVDSLSTLTLEDITKQDIMRRPFAVQARLLQPDPRKEKHVLCIVDQLGNKGLIWPIAHV